VWNLLWNAVKFTPEGGEIDVVVESTDRHVDIVVTDTGVGIDPDFLPQVFDRFRQQEVGTRRRYGGLGLGLAIVRHLVELHGGTVDAASAGAGKGASFRVRLPAHAEPLPPPVRRASAIMRHEPGARLDGVAVLVVDDEPEARELFSSILRQAGASVTTAASAREAMEHLERGPQDVLLSDIEMPNEDGYDLVSRALALASRRGRRQIAVAVTAYARPEDKARSLRAGYQWHLAKPVEPAELVAVIASLTSQKVG
jgi:CheY-like chemotaxis protein